MRKHVILLLAGSVLMASCTFTHQKVHRKSNLMSYLHPDSDEVAPPQSETAALQLPVRIGSAFVPPDVISTQRGGIYELYPPDAEQRLTDIVSKSFAGRDWVGKIQMIPSSYLTRRGGFENLDQVARLMNVDVIALVSVDQLQTSDPRRVSFLYLSIIGAYVLPLDRNETRTLIDAAVFHVPSRTFLLRAPGVSSITGSSSAVDVDKALRERSMRGFEFAMKELSKNLDAEVGRFKANVASGVRKDVDIYTAKGESIARGGDFGVLEALGAVVLALAAAKRRRR
jgi:rhombotail lipoprotein